MWLTKGSVLWEGLLRKCRWGKTSFPNLKEYLLVRGNINKIQQISVWCAWFNQYFRPWLIDMLLQETARPCKTSWHLLALETNHHCTIGEASFKGTPLRPGQQTLWVLVPWWSLLTYSEEAESGLSISRRISWIEWVVFFLKAARFSRLQLFRFQGPPNVGRSSLKLPLAAASRLWKLLRRSFTEDVSGCQWSKDKIEDNKLYVQTLQSFILLLRNWSCGSCLAEMKAMGDSKRSHRAARKRSSLMVAACIIQEKIINSLTFVVSNLTLPWVWAMPGQRKKGQCSHQRGTWFSCQHVEGFQVPWQICFRKQTSRIQCPNCRTDGLLGWVATNHIFLLWWPTHFVKSHFRWSPVLFHGQVPILGGISNAKTPKVRHQCALFDRTDHEALRSCGPLFAWCLVLG